MGEPRSPARRRISTSVLLALLIGVGALALVVVLLWGPLTGALPSGHAPPHDVPLLLNTALR
jgi:hypothetical protein